MDRLPIFTLSPVASPMWLADVEQYSEVDLSPCKGGLFSPTQNYSIDFDLIEEIDLTDALEAAPSQRNTIAAILSSPRALSPLSASGKEGSVESKFEK